MEDVYEGNGNTEITWNDSDFTNAEWRAIGAKTREYREDGHPGSNALKYAVMDMRRGKLPVTVIA